MADTLKNLAYSTVLSVVSQNTTQATVNVQNNDGPLFAVNSQVTVWPVATQPLKSNAMICRITQIIGDQLSLDVTSTYREGTSSRSIQPGDQIASTVTAKALQ